MTSTTLTQPVFVIRYASSAGQADVIGQHIKKLREMGRVVFAKIGKPLGRNRVEQINERSANGQASGGFLVTKVSGKLRVHEVSIERVWLNWREEFRSIAPDYYDIRTMRSVSKCWFVLTSIRERPPFYRGEFCTITGGELVHALDTSIAGIFVAEPSGTRRG